MVLNQTDTNKDDFMKVGSSNNYPDASSSSKETDVMEARWKGILGDRNHHIVRGSSHPKLWFSNQLSNQSNPKFILESLKVVVERVEAAILSSLDSSLKYDQEMSTSVEEDNDLSDPKEPDDLITLDQF